MEDLLQGGAPNDGKLRQVEEAVHHPVVELVRVGRQVLLHSATQYSSSSIIIIIIIIIIKLPKNLYFALNDDIFWNKMKHVVEYSRFPIVLVCRVGGKLGEILIAGMKYILDIF